MNGYVLAAGGVCECPWVRSIDGFACFSVCPENQTSIGGQCRCASDFALSANKAGCERAEASNSTSSDENRIKKLLAAEIAVFACAGALEVVVAALLCCWQKSLKQRQSALEEHARSAKRKIHSL